MNSIHLAFKKGKAPVDVLVILLKGLSFELAGQTAGLICTEGSKRAYEGMGTAGQIATIARGYRIPDSLEQRRGLLLEEGDNLLQCFIVSKVLDKLVTGKDRQQRIVIQSEIVSCVRRSWCKRRLPAVRFR